MYHALDMLHELAPRVGGRPPYHRPRPAPIWREVIEPAWSWRLPLVADPSGPGRWRAAGTDDDQVVLSDTDHVITLDAVAAYLAAASTAEVAHGALAHTGERLFDSRRPGCWRVTEVSPWRWGHLLLPPWGMADISQGVWLTTPTVALMEALGDFGVEFHVADSWTSPTRARLTRWVSQVATDRVAALATGDTESYDAIKIGYSQAITLMSVTAKSKIFRPDWASTIRTAHAANIWRKMWRCAIAGYPVLGTGTIDEIDMTQSSLLSMREMPYHRRPIRVDSSGAALGSFRHKRRLPAAAYTGHGHGSR